MRLIAEIRFPAVATNPGTEETEHTAIITATPGTSTRFHDLVLS